MPTNKADGAWMMEHLAKNFLAHFGEKELMELIWRLCQQSQQSAFVMEGARRADMRIPIIADISASKQN